MRYFSQDQKEVNGGKILGVLISPSWLSGLVVVCLALTMTISLMIAFSVSGTAVQEQLQNWQETKPQMTRSLTQPGEAPPDSTNNSLQSNWPLLTIYGSIGLGIYYIAAAFVSGLRHAEEFREELDYVNAPRDQLIRTASLQLAVRLVSLVVWLAFTVFFFKRIIPYCIAAVHASTGEIGNGTGLALAAFAFIVMTLSLHIHLVFLRLAARRARLITNINYS